jgi:hypothetical protein
MLSVVMLLNVVMLSVIILNVPFKPYMLSVIMLNVIMLIVVAPRAVTMNMKHFFVVLTFCNKLVCFYFRTVLA